MSLDVKWGTPDPIKLSDPKYGIQFLSRHGTVRIQIRYSQVFIKLVGTPKASIKKYPQLFQRHGADEAVLARQISERQFLCPSATDLHPLEKSRKNFRSSVGIRLETGQLLH
jgi:hypothetical protein